MLLITPLLNKDSMNTSHYPELERCKKLTDITEKWRTFSTQLQWYQMVWKPETLRPVQHLAPIDIQEEFVAWCPSVMEMLDVIPNFIEDKKKRVFVIGGMGWYFHATKSYVDYSYTEWGNRYELVNLDWTLPNALADLIFWLHENNYIKF